MPDAVRGKPIARVARRSNVQDWSVREPYEGCPVGLRWLAAAGFRVRRAPIETLRRRPRVLGRVRKSVREESG